MAENAHARRNAEGLKQVGEKGDTVIKTSWQGKRDRYKEVDRQAHRQVEVRVEE